MKTGTEIERLLGVIQLRPAHKRVSGELLQPVAVNAGGEVLGDSLADREV